MIAWQVFKEMTRKHIYLIMMFYCPSAAVDRSINLPKFSEGYAIANSVDPDQTAPLGAV